MFVTRDITRDTELPLIPVRPRFRTPDLAEEGMDAISHIRKGRGSNVERFDVSSRCCVEYCKITFEALLHGKPPTGVVKEKENRLAVADQLRVAAVSCA